MVFYLVVSMSGCVWDLPVSEYLNCKGWGRMFYIADPEFLNQQRRVRAPRSHGDLGLVTALGSLYSCTLLVEWSESMSNCCAVLEREPHITLKVQFQKNVMRHPCADFLIIQMVEPNPQEKIQCPRSPDCHHWGPEALKLLPPPFERIQGRGKRRRKRR